MIDGSEQGRPVTLDGFFARRDQVVEALRSLATVARTIGSPSLVERADTELVRKLQEDRFHLVVVGEFNHGKTTLVNALVGSPVLPVGATPTTATIHQVRWADPPRAAVVSADGERREFGIENVGRFSTGGDAPLEGVDHVEIGLPAPLLSGHLVLVDTPGVNDLSLQRADITYGYVPRADAVLFLLDSGQILTESERVFLTDKLLKGARDKIIFVVTKWDLLAPRDRDTVLRYAREQLSLLVSDPIVFAVSAEGALSGRPDSGVPELVAHLTRFLAEERGAILLDNALGEGLRIAELLRRGIDAKRRALRMNDDELERRIAAFQADLAGRAESVEHRRTKVREELSGIRTGVKRDLDRFVDDVSRQLPSLVDAAQADDLREFLPAFLEDACRRWVDAETREIAAALETLAETTVALVREDAHESASRLTSMLSSDAAHVEVAVETLRYDVGVVALMFGGVALMAVNLMAGGLLALAGPAVFAMFARSKIHEQIRARAKDVAPAALREAAKKLGPKLDSMIEDFGKNLDAWVVTAGQELQRELLEVLTATRTERVERAEREGQADEALRALETGAETLGHAAQRLERLRAPAGGTGHTPKS